jgi:hypothetical protein
MNHVEQLDDPHDDPFADRPPDTEFTNEGAWIEAGTMRRTQPRVFAAPPADANLATESRFFVDWVDQHRESRYPADPSFGHGSAIDVALDALHACRVELPYPAERCGLYVVTCRACGYAISVSTAGRADDPRSVRIPCKPH